MISFLVIVGLLMGLTLPMALGYVGLLAAALMGVFYGAIYAVSWGFETFSQKEASERPWLHEQNKAS